MKIYEDNGYIIKEYPNGTKIRTIISENTEQPNTEIIPTLEDQIKDIKNTVDLLLLKQEGII